MKDRRIFDHNICLIEAPTTLKSQLKIPAFSLTSRSALKKQPIVSMTGQFTRKSGSRQAAIRYGRAKVQRMNIAPKTTPYLKQKIHKRAVEMFNDLEISLRQPNAAHTISDRE